MCVIKLARKNLKKQILAGEPPAWLGRHPRCDYITKMALSTPPWVDMKALWFMQAEAKRLTAETGVVHVIDHIVPVSHPYVSGLTVPWNIQVIPRSVNAFKSNKFAPDQMELSLA